MRQEALHAVVAEVEVVASGDDERVGGVGAISRNLIGVEARAVDECRLTFVLDTVTAAYTYIQHVKQFPCRVNTEYARQSVNYTRRSAWNA